MNLAWRLSLYVILIAVAVFASRRFFAAFNRDMDRAARRFEQYDPSPGETASAITPATDPAAEDGTPPADAATTNAPAVASTNLTSTNASPTPPEAGREAAVSRGMSKGLTGFVAFAAILGLGLMVGRDVSNYMAHRVHREIYGEASDPEGDPDYDEAEQVWANGDHLEAIRLLRAFLEKKPAKLHAAFRIAEIYEKDLQNNLAAALEYETILTRRFDPERWAWAAIHLVNLYNRLGQAAKADALLQRIVAEHPSTEAAAKARERLGLPADGSDDRPPDGDGGEAPPPDDGSFRLPRGFKPKKG